MMLQKKPHGEPGLPAKENATELLKKRRPGYLDGKRIYLSSVTDPYQPLEKELKLTRRLLEIMLNNHTPKLVVQTRSPTVVNDIDLYRKIEKRGGRVQVNMTITTDDESIRKAFEPYCPSTTIGWKRSRKYRPQELTRVSR